MTDEHKAALAAGRNESRVVKNYLDGLESNRPKRGRKRTPDSIKKRLAEIDASLPDADPLMRLNLVQERMDLHEELETMGAKVDMSALEDDFVRVAYSYSSRRGISYAAWREIGVDASVLKKAGLTPRCSQRAGLLALRRGEEAGEDGAAIGRAQELVRRPLRVGHQTDHVAGPVADTGHVPHGSIGVLPVAEHDLIVRDQVGHRRGLNR